MPPLWLLTVGFNFQPSGQHLCSSGSQQSSPSVAEGCSFQRSWWSFLILEPRYPCLDVAVSWLSNCFEPLVSGDHMCAGIYVANAFKQISPSPEVWLQPHLSSWDITAWGWGAWGSFWDKLELLLGLPHGSELVGVMAPWAWEAGWASAGIPPEGVGLLLLGGLKM